MAFPDATGRGQPGGLRRAVAFVSLAVLLAGVVRAQDSFRGWSSIEDPDFAFDPDRRVISSYRLPMSADARLLLQRYREFLSDDNVLSALNCLQQVIDEHGNDVLQVAAERYVGTAEYARFLLSRAPAHVRASYAEMAELRAREKLGAARRDRDVPKLRALARRFANAPLGQEALLELARLARERGNDQVCAAYAGRALDFLVAEDLPEASRRLRVEAQALAALCSARPPPDPGATVKVGGVDTPLQELFEKLHPAPRTDPEDVWGTYGGDARRSRTMPEFGPALRLDPVNLFAVPPDGFRDLRNPLPPSTVVGPPVQPARMGEILFLNNTFSVRAFNLYSNRMEWEFLGPMARPLADGYYFPPEQYFEAHRLSEPGLNPVSKGLVAGVTVARGVVLANLQIPEEQREVGRIGQKITINRPFPWRGLFALSQEDGSLLWSQRGHVVHDDLRGLLLWEGTRLPGDRGGVVTRLDVPGPPAVLDDRVYALGHFIEGGVNPYLVCMDLHTGTVHDTVPLVVGQQELSMFNMPFQEFTSGMPVVCDGAVLCPTNLGLVASVDIAFGDLRWLTAYDALPIKPPPNYYHNEPRDVYWYPCPPAEKDGIVVVAPHDSRYLHAFDVSSGKLLWQREVHRPRESRDQTPAAYFLGIQGAQAVVLDGSLLFALDLRTGKVRWDRDLGVPRPTGRGCVTQSRIVVPTDRAVFVFDTEGKELDSVPWPPSRVASPPRVQPRNDPSIEGNVLVFPDMVVTANQDWAGVAFDAGTVLKELLARQPPRDYRRLTQIASLHRRQGQLDEAARAFEEALAVANPAVVGHREIQRARISLCQTDLERCENALARGLRDAALEALLEAEAHADDLPSRLAVTRRFLADFAEDPEDPRAEEWLLRLRDRHGDERGVFRETGPGDLPVGAWATLELARRLEQAGDRYAALGEYQRLHVEYAAERLGARPLDEFAAAAIEALLEGGGPELRERYHREAREQFEAALAREDVEALGLLLSRYPSTPDRPGYVARYCSLLRARERHADALVAGTRLLGNPRDEDAVRSVLVDMVESALAIGNPGYARALARWSSRNLAGETDRGELAARVGDEPSSSVAAPGPPRKIAEFTVPKGSLLIAGARRLEGDEFPADFPGCLLLEQEQTLKYLSPSGETRWALELPQSEAFPFGFHFVHLAETVILRRDRELLAISLREGTLVWRRMFDDEVNLTACAGLLGVETQRRTAGEGGVALELHALEPRTGREIWSVPLPGDRTNLRLRGDDDTMVSVPFGWIATFDGVTGNQLLEPQPVRATEPLPLVVPGHGLLLVSETLTASGETAGAERVAAYRLGTGELQWTVELDSSDNRLGKVYFLERGIGLLVGRTHKSLLLVDPGTGKLLQRTEIPVLFESFLVPEGEDPAAASLLFCSEGRIIAPQGAHFLALDGAGEVRWDVRREFPDQANPRPVSGVLRQGNQIAVVLEYTLRANRYTDVTTLDADTGATISTVTLQHPTGVIPTSGAYRSGPHVFLLLGEELHVLEWK